MFDFKASLSLLSCDILSGTITDHQVYVQPIQVSRKAAAQSLVEAESLHTHILGRILLSRGPICLGRSCRKSTFNHVLLKGTVVPLVV